MDRYDFFVYLYGDHRDLHVLTHSFPTRLSSDLLCTSLSNEAGVSVSTVEHLMAAFAGCEIDNALVELNGPEVTIMDGSAGPFVFLIECAGPVDQDAPRRVIRALRPVTGHAQGKREANGTAAGLSNNQHGSTTGREQKD